MDILLLILSILLLIGGLAGCILPVLPGPPLSFLAIVLIHFTRFAAFSHQQLVLFGLLAVVVQLLDYVVPVWGAKKFGGSRAGMWGSVLGLIAGLFFLPLIGPFGIITILGGPFIGAFLGETLSGRQEDIALKAAFGTFLGFLAGTLMKLVTSTILTVVFIREMFR